MIRDPGSGHAGTINPQPPVAEAPML